MDLSLFLGLNNTKIRCIQYVVFKLSSFLLIGSSIVQTLKTDFTLILISKCQQKNISKWSIRLYQMTSCFIKTLTAFYQSLTDFYDFFYNIKKYY